MGHQVLVAVFDAAEYLLEVGAPQFLGHFSVVVDEAEELPSGGQLHDDEDVSEVVEHFVQANDVGVVEVAQEPDLSFGLSHGSRYLRAHLFCLHLLLIDDLDGHLGASEFVHGLYLTPSEYLSRSKPPCPRVFPSM